MASETNAAWVMLEQVARRNRNQDALRKNLKVSFEALSKEHISASSKFRQTRAVSLLDHIRKDTNGAVFIACVLAGYTVLATVPKSMDLFRSWYEAHKEEQFVLLADAAYRDSAEEVNKLLKRANTLGALAATTHTQAQLKSKQVLVLGASAAAHRGTLPALPQDLNAPSTPPYTQPQIELRQNLSTLGASVHTNTDTLPEIPQEINLGQNLGALPASTHGNTDAYLWSTQVRSLGSSKQTHTQHASNEQPSVPISFDDFVNCVHAFAEYQLQPYLCFEGSIMRGIGFSLNNVNVGYWSMSEEIAQWAYMTLSLSTYASTRSTVG